MNHSIEIAATVCFVLAILHTFSVKFFHNLARRYPNGSVAENLFHLLGEIEVVFGIWSAILIIFITFSDNLKSAIDYLESSNFTEPAFVFVIMAVCSTKPILKLAETLILVISKALPIHKTISFYFTTLVVGPLLGSFITEPAAMTVTALILLHNFYKKKISTKFKYATLGLLFVNISIGGTLTHFAAPPVIMVANKWGWDLNFMFTHFGWKAIITVLVTAILVTFRFRNELKQIGQIEQKQDEKVMPIWVYVTHLLFLAGIVASSHHMIVFMGLFLFFLGLFQVSQEFHTPLKLKEPLLVGFFLGGLVVLGGMQRWWLEPLLTQLSQATLYLGAIALTAVTDNAALTYLGSQVPTLSEFSRYALVAGSVVGGGLTIIANAPNPAGYGILNSSFEGGGISARDLFLNALMPTIIAGLAFWFL